MTTAVEKSIKNKGNYFLVTFLVLGELEDVTNAALLLFTGRINAKFDISEEF